MIAEFQSFTAPIPTGTEAAAVRAVAATAVARAVPLASLEPAATDGRGLVGLDGREVCLCDPCAPVCPVCVPAPPGVFLPVIARNLVEISLDDGPG